MRPERVARLSTLVVHLHNGAFPRTRRLRDQPLLFGAPYHLLSLLLEPNAKSDRPIPQDWTQDEIARHLGQPVGAVRRAFKILKDAGYWICKRRSLGRGRWHTWWAVTDEAGEFGEFDRYVAHDLARMLAGAEYEQVTTDDALQRTINSAEPPVPGVEGTSTPPPPAVDNSSTPPPSSRWRRRRTPREQLTRASKARARLKPPMLLPDELVDLAARGIKLAHSLGIPPWMRPEVAGYLAILLRAGEDENELFRALSTNLEGVNAPANVMRWRAQTRAEKLAPALAATVKRMARERHAAA